MTKQQFANCKIQEQIKEQIKELSQHSETKSEFNAQIESLTQSNDAFIETISSLETTIEKLSSGQVEILDHFKLERSSLDDKLAKQQIDIEELSRSIAFHEDINIKLANKDNDFQH